MNFSTIFHISIAERKKVFKFIFLILIKREKPLSLALEVNGQAQLGLETLKIKTKSIILKERHRINNYVKIVKNGQKVKEKGKYHEPNILPVFSNLFPYPDLAKKVEPI